MTKGSASTPPTSPWSYATPGALHRRPRRLPHLWPPEIAGARSPPPTSPPSRWALQSTPCKPRHRSPLPPFSFARSGRRFHQGRNPPPHVVDAGVTPVTIWSRTSVQRTRGCTQSMASALVGSFARCNTKPATHPNAGRRPNARRRRSRPPHAQPPAPLDAEHSKLSIEPSRVPNRRRTAISEARRRVLWSPATHRRRI